MKKRALIFLFFVLIISSGQVLAQCAQKWDDAQSEFKEGHLYSIPSLLGDCLESGFTKQEKVEAYRMLTIAYLYIDDPFGAQNSFLGLLKLDPEYRIKTSDPIELEHLSKEFITTPIVSWRFRGGMNYSFVNVILTRSSGNSLLNTETYSLTPGFSVTGSFDLHFNKIISLGVEGELLTNSFRHSDKIFDNENGDQNAKDPQNFKEVGYNASLPVYLKATYPGIKYYPYIYVGYAPTYNIYTRSTADYVVNLSESINPLDVERLNLTPIRTKFSNALVFGAGLMRRIGYKYVFVDVRYKLGLTSLLNDKQFDLQERDINTYTLTYLKEDSYFKVSDVSLTLGYVWPQYKPRKKKTVTFGSAVKGMFKKKNKDE